MTMGKTVLVTGADGFVGKNLLTRLAEAGYTNVRTLVRGASAEDIEAAVTSVDVIFHLAGSNRPEKPEDFMIVNYDFTAHLLAAVVAAKIRPFVVYSSSTKATEDSEYGRSKKAAEDSLISFAQAGAGRVALYRLPNIFGKWCRPNYNSAVATFCHNIARKLPVRVNDPTSPLTLIYIDDLIDQWLEQLALPIPETGIIAPKTCYETDVGSVVSLIQSFKDDRDVQMIESVGTGLTRALYSTYVSTLPLSEFSYAIPAHTDPRGSFSEMLKTRMSGQFSYFTAHPGVTRGGHYHHTKTEKFLIVHGEALFRFRHILTGEVHEIKTSSETPVVVETIPGWAHDVTNVGDNVLVSLLWANEIFDRSRPDTITAKV